MWDYSCYELYAKISTIEEVGLELVASLYHLRVPLGFDTDHNKRLY